MSDADPHADRPVRTAGVPLADADVAVVFCHGRGASAGSVLGLASEFDADRVAVLAPAAANNTWYPQSFLAPTESNEPWLSSALATVGRTVDRATDAGVPVERVVLGGFSQGACLASEYAARNARRYGGIVALSGGLIGPEGTPRAYDGSLDGTPAFVGCSDRDPHIPLERVRETTETLEALDADVDERIYEGMGHTINRDELDAVADLVASVEP